MIIENILERLVVSPCYLNVVAFSNIRNWMLKRDLEVRPFYLFVRQFVCDLKIPSWSSVITPFKVCNISIAGCQIFWWWIEKKPCNKSILLKSDLHVQESFCQIKIFPSLVRRSTIKICKICFLKKQADLKNKLYQAVTFRVNDSV